MIKIIEGDLLKGDAQFILHQCNCFHKMGAGIAKQISLKYPNALQIDKQTIYGDKNKLGTYSVSEETDGKTIINIYSQFEYGTGKKQTDYNALLIALTKIKNVFGFKLDYMQPITFGLPYGMGCGLAGGDWNKVEKIIKSVFANSTSTELQIYKFDG